MLFNLRSGLSAISRHQKSIAIAITRQYPGVDKLHRITLITKRLHHLLDLLFLLLHTFVPQLILPYLQIREDLSPISHLPRMSRRIGVMIDLAHLFLGFGRGLICEAVRSLAQAAELGALGRLFTCVFSAFLRHSRADVAVTESHD